MFLLSFKQATELECGLFRTASRLCTFEGMTYEDALTKPVVKLQPKDKLDMVVEQRQSMANMMAVFAGLRASFRALGKI